MGKWGVLGGAVVAAASVARASRTIGTWRRVERLPSGRAGGGLVTVVVPARDEEATIDRCLTALRGQDHADLRIVVVDDASADRTAEIVRRHAEQDARVRLVSSSGPPSGWAGKVHAMHLGAEAAEGDHLLFVDADTEAAPDLVSRLLAAAHRDRADLVSTAGRATRPNAGWWLLLAPTNVLLFETTSPDGGRGKAPAVGHCVLVSREAYRRAGGWRSVAGSRGDDVAFATRVRDTGGRTRLVDGVDSLTTSGLDTFGDTWRSTRKSLLAGATEATTGPASAAVAFGALGVAQVGYGLGPLLLVLRGRGSARLAGVVAWLAQAAAHWSYLRRCRQPEAAALLAPVASATFGVLVLDVARRALGGGAAWKGRDVRG